MKTETFGDRVRELRNRKGWTQTLLAERAGLKQKVVSEVESRNRPPKGAVIVSLAHALGVSTDFLLGVE